MDRPASFLPTIKCSSCSQEIEISMMGEHICGKVAEESAPAPPANFDQFMSYGSKNGSSSNYGYSSRDQDRPNRLPPQVDTSAANRSYYRTGQLTPVSNSSGSQSVSPKTPVGMMMGGLRTGGLGGSRGNDRNMSDRNDRNAGSNDYFEPKIADEFDSPSAYGSSTQPRRPGGYGGLDDDAYPPPSSSPKRQPATNLLQRMNTIAPGPFDVDSSGLGRKPTNARNAFPRAANNSDYSRENMEGRNLTLDDDDFQPPAFNRAGTFPRLSESAELPSRTPSAPGPRPERRRQANNDGYGNMGNMGQNNNNSYGSSSQPSDPMRRPIMGPDTSRAPPPRTSLLRPRTSGRDDSTDSSTPTIPKINLAAEFGIGNPYHSASDSMSSTVSSVASRPGGNLALSSSQSSFSSASSFTTSSTSNSPNKSGTNNYYNINNNSRDQVREVPREQPRKPSNASNMADFDSLMNDLQALNPSEDLRDERREERPLPTQDERGRNGSYGGFGASNTPSSSNSRSSPDRWPQSRGRNAMQDDTDNGSGSNGNGSLRRDPSRARDQSIGALSRNGNGSSWSRGAGANNMAPPMPSIPTIPVVPTMPSRGNCKACGDLITGKSVSSADGRLTGRYHKACFVCTTCSEPFSSATFYVHNDQPYCERHYHAVNGSLCGSCGNGIEGSYLADEADSKFHPTCFVCADCRLPLEDGYFEVAGAVYCERDAWKRVQQTWLSQAPLTPASSVSSASSRGGMGNNLAVPRGNGLPSGPGVSRRPSVGLPNPNALGSAARPFGLPSGNRLGPRPRMEKRMTRLGMM
ncbi:lim domain containing protein [Sporothrix schenckii 1099-18]|uniref:LIM zinc-binding domain-containing protein n=2 Tax=Sporothrix schenckii TaxID=29908 RepID=U7Q796_SPOS1|nr:lim domain containing protein [Sporothrix schenckii 1099-18]ERT03077.1 hypothetical protein HMPREF1624_01382 [Sporothrix schenckii ATCC 58251]KJR84522.1 lim domain containing protein [Sporothrix schenckii 1099-18]